MFKNKGRVSRMKMYPIRLIAMGFALIILIGSFLLMLPLASKSGLSIDFTDALFTSASATCVTGLVVVDTFQQWSLFGQLVILCLIQIGGLGFITFGTYMLVLFRQKIGLKGREYVKESLNILQLSGVVKLVIHIINWTFVVEIIGAALLSIRFIPQFGLFRGMYFSVFHSVSAFCNAGFDLMGIHSAFSSFCAYSDDWLVNFVLSSLIIIGGIGFVVIDDIVKYKFHFRRYVLHSKLVIITTLILIVLGTVVYFLLEKDNLFSNMSISEKWLSSYFSSITARTAGFNTTDTSALSSPSKLFTMILMFIGGSPASCAGGVKTTTIAIIFITLYSHLKNTDEVNIFGRSLYQSAIQKATVVITINLLLSISGVMFIMIFQNLSLEDTLFEVFSAIETVGMSTGITGDLCTSSKIVLVLLMYSGRLGSLTFAFIFARTGVKPPIRRPKEKLIVG